MESQIKKAEDEYVIKDVSPVFLTDETLTPNNLPRITQPSFGKYLVRTDGKPETTTSEVHPSIMNKWINKNRENLVPAPHKSACVFELAKKYSRMDNYHPRNIYTFPIFARPYCCELEYIQAQRLKNLNLIEERYNESFEGASTGSVIPEKKICAFDSPFWWKDTSMVNYKITNQQVHDETEEKCEELRWKPVPDLLARKTSCERRKQLAEVGLPFKHEALKFYSEHFPRPTMKNKYLRIH